MHVVEPLVHEPKSFVEVEFVIEQLKRYTSPGIDQIPVELIQVRSDILHSEIHELINSVWNREEVPQQW
jgi:hypothetical protein